MRYDDPSDVYNPGASAPPTPTASAPPVTAPAPAPSSAITLSAGTTPDYTGLITSDSGYLAAKSAADLAQSTAAAQRKAALRQALVRYGGLPAGFTDQYGDIDQATQDEAAGNQNSTLARLASEYAKSGEQFRRSLASRGALQSGDLNYGQDQLDQAYSQQRYDAANSFGSDANQALNSYAGVLSGNAQNIAGAIQGAEGNVYSNPAYRPTPAVTANYDGSRSSAYGQPIYTDDQGNMFDQNGNPFSPPSTSSNATTPTPMDANGNSAPVPQNPYVAGPADANGVPISAGFYGFDANGNWIGG